MTINKKQTHSASGNNLEDFIGKYTAHAETYMLLIKPQTKLKPYNQIQKTLFV